MKVETKVECGDPRKGICEAVASLGVDLLIMIWSIQVAMFYHLCALVHSRIFRDATFT